MIQSKISDNVDFGETIARQSGELAVGCSDAAGQVQMVNESIADQIRILGELQSVLSSLETDQRQVAHAGDEARILSDGARRRLQASSTTITASMDEFSELTALVARLGTKITSFATAMEQVRRTTETIDAIARTTKMLALNAAIEAERAGDAGRSFAVVAAEVKKLSRDTRAATDEIGATMVSLAAEAEAFVGEVGDAVERSREAEHGFEVVRDTMSEVARLVEQVDRQTDDIARSACLVHDNVCRVGEEVNGFVASARANSDRLSTAHAHMDALELQANGVLDTVVRTGVAAADRRFVDIAIARRDHFVAITEAALAEGKLREADLFDTDYRLIPGSNPPRYDNRANSFADAVWRPELDATVTLDPGIVSSAATDVKGYLPTHTTAYSRPPTGDPVVDAAFSRHRRLFCDATDEAAKASTKPFHLAVYRRERSDGGFDVVRNVYVPMVIRGRRWGDLEIAYQID